MLLSCCTKNSQDATVLTALKAVQDAEKKHPHKDQVQRLIPIRLDMSGPRPGQVQVSDTSTARFSWGL
jgi:hypothetical protein